jgi:hypothetical protein
MCLVYRGKMLISVKCSFYYILKMYRAYVEVICVMSTGHLNSSVMSRGTWYGSLMQYMICHSKAFIFTNFFYNLQMRSLNYSVMKLAVLCIGTQIFKINLC